MESAPGGNARALSEEPTMKQDHATGHRAALGFGPVVWLVFAALYGMLLAVPIHAQSAADCAARADRAARDSASALTGAVRGSIGGAAFGAIVSDKTSKGAKRGAALGAVVGGATAAHNHDEVYKRVYDDCMKNQ